MNLWLKNWGLSCVNGIQISLMCPSQRLEGLRTIDINAFIFKNLFCCKEIGWVCTRLHYCQLIREANKLKRKEWCQRQIDNNEQFEDIVFKRSIAEHWSRGYTASIHFASIFF